MAELRNDSPEFELRKIPIEDLPVTCSWCKNILDLSSTELVTIQHNGKRIREELYKCRKCNGLFIVVYRLFNVQGHIEDYWLSSDPNDATYDWQSQLTQEQLCEIENHLKSCRYCQDVVDRQLLLDSWFADILVAKAIWRGYNWLE